MTFKRIKFSANVVIKNSVTGKRLKQKTHIVNYGNIQEFQFAPERIKVEEIGTEPCISSVNLTKI